MPRWRTSPSRIELALAPHARIVELLCTIPGVQAHAAQVPIAECGLNMARVSDRTALRLVGRGVPRPPRISRPSAPGAHPSRPALAHRAAHRMRPRRRSHQGHLSRCPLRAKRGRRGEPKAIGAIRHDLLVATTASFATRSHIASRTGSTSATQPSTAPAPSTTTRSALGYTVSLQARRIPAAIATVAQRGVRWACGTRGACEVGR
jgi:hypothetical protein